MTAFLVLWSADRIKALRQRGELGQPPRVLYGSPHGSAPKLTRYGVAPGDAVYVVMLAKGVVSIVTRIEVAEIIDVDAFMQRLGVDAADRALHLWAMIDKLARARRELGHALPFGCVDEAAIPARATPMRVDVPIGPDILGALRFCDKRGAERGLPLVDGKLTKANSIQGHVYRLTPASAALLARVVDDAPAGAAAAPARSTARRPRGA